MRKLLLAGFLALASCHAAPAFAQEEKCSALAPLLIDAGAARAAGARVVVFSGAKAAVGVEAIGAMSGPPPREISATTLVLVSMEGKALIIIGEGDKACFVMQTSAKNARVIELAVTGEPA